MREIWDELRDDEDLKPENLSAEQKEGLMQELEDQRRSRNLGARANNRAASLDSAAVVDKTDNEVSVFCRSEDEYSQPWYSSQSYTPGQECAP